MAANPFRRGRDLIRSWSASKRDEAILSLRFDPGDVSAGDIVHYDFGVDAPENGEVLKISSEHLWLKSGDSRTDIIRTEDGIRFYRVPPTRSNARVKGQKLARKNVGERDGSDWIRIDDSYTPALKHVDIMFSQGGHALRNWLDGMITLRLSPTAIADFSPLRPRRGKKELDPLGSQTSELLSLLSDDERQAVLSKLKFVTGGFSKITPHKPSGPGDQRYFSVREQSGGRAVEIPAWVLSEGTRRLTSILAVALRDKPPPLVAIEEVENGFDPWTLRFVIEELVACSERGTQIVLTTHSPYLMNMLPRDVFHFVNREDGSPRFSRLDGDSSERRVLNVMGVGDAYAGNLLRSKP